MVKFMKKIPAGMMLVPILIGALINTFCPELLKIGDPTEILFTSKGMSCLLGLIIFFTGTQIKIKDLKKNLKKSFVLVATKLIVAYGLSYIFYRLFGMAGVLGISFVAIVSVLTSTNGVLYYGIVDEYHAKEDYTTFCFIALYSMPIIPTLFLTSFGGSMDITAVISLIVPFLLGFLLGNLDDEWTKLFKNGSAMLFPIVGLQFGSLIDLGSIISDIPRGLLLVIIFYICSIIPTYLVDKKILKNDGHSAIAMASVAGGSLSIPYFCAEIIPEYQVYLSSAISQVSICMLVTTFLTPFLTKYIVQKFKTKKLDKQKVLSKD